MPKARVNGIELYYKLYGPTPSIPFPAREGEAPRPVAGRDFEAVLLANGVLADTKSWAGQLRAFAREYFVLLFDFRGQGQSDMPDEPYSIDNHAADTVGLLETLGIERVHWVGTSYGGEIGMVVAARYPEMIASLTVVASVSHVELPLRHRIEKWIVAARTANPELFFAETATDIFSDRFRSENARFLKTVQASYAHLNYRTIVRLLEAFQQLNIAPELHKITAPTLVLCGANDSLKPPSYSEIIHRAIAHSQFAMVSDCGHALTLERPQKFNDLVLRFLEQQRGHV